MFAIKNPSAGGARLMIFALLVLVVAGCTPPGPRALIEGERLIEGGDFQKAVSRLEVATELMPANARAWNFLGLALHGAGRRQEAAQAYQRAVGLDQDLAVARYNMGCLQLEAGNAAAAEAEFTAFTLSREESMEGRLKLASAQLRGAKFGSAENSYARALALDRESAEAWNGLGLALLGRGRVKEAGPYFDKALNCDPNYAPALLNRAIYQQQHARNLRAALQSFRAYLALEPRAPDWGRVQQLVSHLERPVAPPARPEVAAVKEAGTPPAAIAAAKPSENTEPKRLPTGDVTPPPQRTTPAPSTPARETKPEPVAPQRPILRQTEPDRSPASSFEVVQLDQPDTIQPARDSGTAVRAEPAGTVANPIEVTPPPPAREKPGLLARLNPANLFRREPDPPVRPTPLPSASEVDAVASTRTEGVRSPTDSTSARASRPYPYRGDIDLKPGDRGIAQGLFARGAEAHRVRDLDAAVSLYEAALRADPAYFDVQYNLGLAQYQRGDWMASARAYERALALNASSSQARYNFSLALRQGGFFGDAARELEKLLVIHPREVQARLALANLYANELRSPKLARAHYEKVLEESPGHPNAIEIRYWLRANP